MRATLITVVVLLAAGMPAHAASVDVTWPDQRTYAPGDQIRVAVKAERAVRVAVVRTTAKGKVMAVVKRRTLERGALWTTLPRAGTYQVRVERRTRTLTVVAPDTPVSSPAAPPPSAPPVFPIDCMHATSPAVEVRLGAPTVRRGEQLPYTIVNTSDTCITGGASYALEHQRPDGTWAPAPWQLLFPMYAVMIPPGEKYAKTVRVPADAPLGTYRLIENAGFTEPTFEVVA
ncbi:hypothetical protein DVA67_014270 [Solirubrobacter sp. CPCC 204708]|uniref:Bacterial Ig-like domain-containing protein n=1 Tax=Solirubrobacter deserti TaxID=2282478 RepID=A0ABT4RBQ7_9ACTN|nr:immunoglobulin-like domain-containing protein [Solirubrobacter deserti]MBE2317143.1 hypothetical protein [Solirubrobacter deserti]MDA0135964.1 hypothetical protein [Solirubrobacter deserti]